MFPRAARLTIRNFPRRPQKQLNLPCFTVKLAQNQAGRNRYAVILSARAEKSAVRRHRIKRVVAAITRLWPTHNLDILFVFRTPANPFTDQEVRACLKTTEQQILA